MSDALKKIYSDLGLSDRFWDTSTPVDLWRAQKKSEFEQDYMVLQPHPGNETRLPDVMVEERDGQMMVRGCRCVKGDFRGVSTSESPEPIREAGLLRPLEEEQKCSKTQTL